MKIGGTMKENILNLFLIITTSLIIAVLGIYIFKTTKNNTKPDDYYNNLPVYYKNYLSKIHFLA